MNQSALKTRRAELQLSQEDLGKKIGVAGMTIYRWERGETIPHRRLWSKLEKVTGLSVGDIVGLGSKAKNGGAK